MVSLLGSCVVGELGMIQLSGCQVWDLDSKTMPNQPNT